jgi:hypothetical protein
MKILNKKFGGMISGDCDNKTKKTTRIKKNHLFFSHGRSAMIWLVQNYNYDSCLMCAYTWPAIPSLMKKLNLEIDFYDLFEKNLEKKLKEMKGKVLLIVSVFYGFKPWLDLNKISKKFKKKVFILIDSAQTAYGHNDYKIPLNGAILSCPHKSLSTNDGSVLALSKLDKKLLSSYNRLTREKNFSIIKDRSRKLLNSNQLNLEKKGILLSKKLEEKWQSFPPKKISKKSYEEFLKIDPIIHKKKRIKNYKYLSSFMKKKFYFIKTLKLGTPFGYPVLTKKRDKLIKHLYKERIFATKLWFNNSYINKKYPIALKFKNEFLAFPLDQRYKKSDLDIMKIKIDNILKKI